ncbi:unnamed protein product [Periconia digitata]|uniref:Uncharacterized protein n=1 Tax=Periconia digitata TaxID=1303443 RepID=A0A9W4UR42_9PLEO|nr:unnamed protein product [Periconia digitata]
MFYTDLLPQPSCADSPFGSPPSSGHGLRTTKTRRPPCLWGVNKTQKSFPARLRTCGGSTIPSANLILPHPRRTLSAWEPRLCAGSERKPGVPNIPNQNMPISTSAPLRATSLFIVYLSFFFFFPFVVVCLDFLMEPHTSAMLAFFHPLIFCSRMTVVAMVRTRTATASMDTIQGKPHVSDTIFSCAYSQKNASTPISSEQAFISVSLKIALRFAEKVPVSNHFQPPERWIGRKRNPNQKPLHSCFETSHPTWRDQPPCLNQVFLFLSRGPSPPYRR